MRRTVVKKFGGSSVADPAHLQAVADHVVAAHNRGDRVVVVVSAMGKTTDALVKLAHDVSPTPDPRELDMLLTAGERIAMALLAMAIRDRGVPATSLTGSQAGIITNARAGSARIVEVRPFRVEDALDDGHVVIIAGFQGVSYRREVTTLGRGGSDTTAVAIAAALRAEACEIYTDVAGVYSADPRVCLDAKHIAELSYDEMLELARAGAKVLAEECIVWARQAGVALYVRASDGRVGDSMVRFDEPKAPSRLVGVALRPDTRLWRFVDHGGVRAEVIAVLEAAGLPALVEVVVDTRDPAHQDAAACDFVELCVARDVADAVGAVFGRASARIDAIVVAAGGAPGVAGTLVSVVGSAVARDPAFGPRFDALVAGAMPRAVIGHGLLRSALVEASEAAALAQVLHSVLFDGAEVAP